MSSDAAEPSSKPSPPSSGAASPGAGSPAPADAARSRLTGGLLVAAAAVLWSTSGLFAKAPLFDDWPLGERGALLAFWRALFAGLALLPLGPRPSWSWSMPVMVALFAAMNLSYLQALTLTTAANAIWLQNISPVWVFLIGVWALGESWRRADGWMIACGAVGVGLIVVCEAQGQDLVGVLCGLFSGLMLAGVILSLRGLRGHNSAWLVTLNLLVTAALLAPYVLWLGRWPSAGQFAVLALFGGLQMGLPYWLFAQGLRRIPGHEAAAIALLEPILVPVWVHLAWSGWPGYQPPAWWTLVGGAIILMGLTLRVLAAAWPRRNTPRRNTPRPNIPAA